jgi:hypothetical protein
MAQDLCLGNKKGHIVDKERDHTKVSITTRRNIETLARGKSSLAHVWDGEEQQSPASESVGCPDSVPCEYKVDEAKAEPG